MAIKVFGRAIYDNVPKGVFRDRRLSASDKALYEYLCEKAELKQKFRINIRSQKEIADELGYTRKTINRAAKKLEDYGLIEIIKFPGFTAEYKIMDAAKSKFALESQKPELFKEYLAEKEEKPEETRKYETINLTEEQLELKLYIENKINATLTKNKIKILTDVAAENKEIGDVIATIKNIVDTVIDYKNKSKKIIRNIFGYIKKSIREYTAEQNPVEPIENKSSEYVDTAMSLTLKLKYDYEERYHLTYKQCLALCTIAANKVYLEGTELYNFLLFDIINQTRHNTEIRDIFRYLITMINSYSEGYEYQETSYDEPKITENNYSANLRSYSELLKEFQNGNVQYC